MTKIVAITSSKEGVGKTTAAINLGTSLNIFGRNVIVMDSNFSSPHLGLHLGATAVPITLHHVVKGLNHISEATYLHPCGLKIIPASLAYEEYKTIEHSRIKSVLDDLRGYSEVVLLDTPAGLGNDTNHVLNSADYAIIVTTPDLVSLTDALKSIKLAQEHNTEVLGVIVNQIRNEPFELTKNNIETFLEKPVLGMIPYSPMFRHSVSLKNPFVYLYPEHEATNEYKKIAAHLVGEKYKAKKKKEPMLSKLFESIGIKLRFIPSARFKD